MQVMGGQRQFLKYTFFKVAPEWRRLPRETREAGKREFAAAVDGATANGDLLIRSYTLMGLRGDADFLLWQVTERLEALVELSTQLFSTGLGSYLTTPHSYLTMTRRSLYLRGHQHPGQEGTRLTRVPSSARYLFVYPFVKTREWYTLPLEARQEMMNEHFRAGHRYPGVRINTGYSFGMDDQEFVVAFDTDDAASFLDLVMELRESQASRYTLRDTPAFTCVQLPLAEVLDSLGGGEGDGQSAAGGD